MAGRKTQSKGSVRTVKVRFLRPVKMAGRWYMAGDEATFSNSIAKELVKRGLVKKLASSRSVSKRDK